MEDEDRQHTTSAVGLEYLMCFHYGFFLCVCVCVCGRVFGVFCYLVKERILEFFIALKMKHFFPSQIIDFWHQ